MNDREILEELCIDQPWSTSWEGLDDCCLFCGSGAMEYGTVVEGAKYWHEDSCAWIKAMAHLSREHPEHGMLRDRPKPKPKPCMVCAADPDSTLDSHMAHLSREFARWKEKVLQRRMKGLPDESIMDSFVGFTSERGGIQFITPPPIKTDAGKVIGHIDKLEVTESGIVASGAMVSPPSALYDFAPKRQELPDRFEPDEDDIAAYHAAKDQPEIS